MITDALGVTQAVIVLSTTIGGFLRDVDERPQLQLTATTESEASV